MKRFLLLPLLLLFISPATATEETLSATADKAEYHVGDPISLQIRLNGKGYTFGRIDEEKIKPFEIQGREEIFDEEKGETRLLLKGSIYKTGNFELPSLSILDGEGKEILTAPFSLTVVSLVGKDDKEIRPLKPQMTLAERGPLWPWILLALFLLGAGALLWWLLRKKKTAETPVAVPPPVPPHEEALSTLERIRGMNLPREGRIKEYYTLVSDAVRLCEGRVYGIDAMEKTTGEIMEALSRCEATGTADLRRFLEDADRVKFARHTPPELDIAALMDRAEALVRRHIPHVETPEEAGHAV